MGIEFDKETGNLSKYGLKKESQLSENTEAISNAIGTMNTEIYDLKTALENKREKEKEENSNKDIKDEIDRLKLEKDKLELIIEKQKLKEEIEARKKDKKRKKTP